MKRMPLITLCLMLLPLLLPFAAAAQMKSTFGNALVDAADQGIEALVSAQIRNGHNVNVRGNFGVTPLMRAAYQGYTNIMELLINLGADVNLTDEGGATALHLAARQGHLEAVKLLIKYDAVLDMADGEGWTPLMRATAGRKEEVAEVLLKAGANSQVKNEWGDSPLTFAEKFPSNAPLLALMQQAPAMSRSSLTALEATRQNISVPVEQVLPQYLPATAFADNDAENVMPEPKHEVTGAELLAQVEADKAKLAVDMELAQHAALSQQLEAEQMAREQAEAQLQEAVANRQQQEAELKALAEAKAQAEAEALAKAEAERQEKLLAQENTKREMELAQARLEAEKKAMEEAERKAQLLAQANAARAEQLAQQKAEAARKQQLAQQRKEMELALLREQRARRAAEEKLRLEMARQEKLAKQEKQLAAANMPEGMPQPENKTKGDNSDILIGEAVSVPVTSNPFLVATANPRPSLLKMSKGVWLQMGPFGAEQEAIAYYDRAIQTMTDFLPQRMKIIASNFLTDAVPQNFLRVGPYTSQKIAELACNAFRHSDLLCQYIREEAAERYTRGRL